MLSASAAVVAVSALLVSSYQTKIMREQQKMSAWPRVAEGNTGGDSTYAWVISNVGVGPAVVRSATISTHGRALHDWGDVLRAALHIDGTALDSAIAHARITTSSVRRGRVLLSGATTELIRVDGPLGKPLRRFLNDSTTLLRLCYCSVYDDCWAIDSRADEPVEVRACPDEPPREFRR